MVTTLPRASGAAFGSPRRGARAQLPTAENVPIVQPQSDPGLDATGAFGQEEFAGLEDVGRAITSVAIVGSNIKRRDEGNARDAGDIAAVGALDEIENGLDESGDFSNKRAVELAVELAQEKLDGIEGEHEGGGASREMLRNRLDARMVQFTDTLAMKQIAASDSEQRTSFQRRLNATTKTVLEDPEVLTSDDLGAVFLKHVAAAEQDIEFLNPAPQRARIFLATAEQSIATNMLTPMIKEGTPESFQRAHDFLSNPVTAEVLPEAARREMTQRIVDSQRALTAATAAGEAARATAGALLGPDATEEQITTVAMRIANAEGQGVQFVQSGNTVSVFDQTTGDLLETHQIQSAEELAEFETIKQRIVNAGRLEMINAALGDLAPNLNIPPMTQPVTAGAEPGSEGPEVAPGHVELPEVAHPLGPNIEVSEDYKSMMRLFAQAQRLLVAEAATGEELGGRDKLAEAAWLAQNSRDIAAGNKLRLPLSTEAAVLMGLPIGSTMADGLGKMLPTIGEQAFERGLAQSQARAVTDAQKQLDFVNEGEEVIEDILEKIRANPEIAGIRGSLLRVAQSTMGTVEDLADMVPLIDTLKDVAETIVEDADNGTELSTQGFFDLVHNPETSVIGIIENTIGLISARLAQPTGRLTVKIIDDAIEETQLTGPGGTPAVINRLEFILARLQRRGGRLRERMLRRPGNIAEPDEPAPVPDFVFDQEAQKFVPNPELEQ